MRIRRNRTFIVAAVMAVALVGGSVFTAGITMDMGAQHAGAGTVTVEGYTATDMTLNRTEDEVTSADFVIMGDIAESSTAEVELADGDGFNSCTISYNTETDVDDEVSCTNLATPVDTVGAVTLVIADN